MLVIVNVLSTCFGGMLLDGMVVTNRKFWTVPFVVLQWTCALKFVVFVLAEKASAVTTAVPGHVRDDFSIFLSKSVQH